VTLLPAHTLVPGSQNVMTNVYGRIGIRKGFVRDDATDIAAGTGGVVTAFDWERHVGDIKNLRAGGLTPSGSDGVLQMRWTDPNSVAYGANVPVWIPILTGLSSVSFNFANFWDFNTELKDLLLMVNGGLSVYEWSGATATFASATLNTVTLQGTKTWAELGFYSQGTRGFTIIDDLGAQHAYTYTGGEDTDTLTGVSGDLTLLTLTPGAPIFQTVRTTSNGAITSLPAAAPWSNDLISNLKNQIYYGCLTQNSVYVSQVNNYKTVAFTTPVRVVGEGSRLDLDAPPVSFAPQEDQMYISAGKDQWYTTQFTLSSDLSKESLNVQRLKTTARQGSQSQALTTKIRDNVVFVSNEPVISVLGRVSQTIPTPIITDISHPIINDMTGYDFTGGSAFYFQNFLYVTVPSTGKVIIFNMTNPQSTYWEPPQFMSLSCFSIIDGALYGHSSGTLRSYKLFEGYNDDGFPIVSKALFAFNSNGMRPTLKGFNRFYVEGYISSNTKLTLGIQYDLDGKATITSYDILGNDGRIVALPVSQAPIGKMPLGKLPIGGDIAIPQLPPKFRVVKTFPRKSHYEYQVGFSSEGLNQQWEVLAFGPATVPTSEQNVAITE